MGAAMKRLLLLLVLTACGGNAEQVVKETVDAVRPKKTVVIQVRLDRSELPSEEDLQVRRELEEEIEVSRIGRVVTTGAGVGYFDIRVEVGSTIEAVPKIEKLLGERALRERSVVRVQ
jgi:hypothetical protein